MVFFVSDEFKMLKTLYYPHILQLQEIFLLTLGKIVAPNMAVLNSHKVQQVLLRTFMRYTKLIPHGG